MSDHIDGVLDTLLTRIEVCVRTAREARATHRIRAAEAGQASQIVAPVAARISNGQPVASEADRKAAEAQHALQVGGHALMEAMNLSLMMIDAAGGNIGRRVRSMRIEAGAVVGLDMVGVSEPE